jgi:hypothetical protein
MFPPLLMFSPVRFVCTKPFPFILVAGPAPYSQDSHGNMQMQLFLTLAVNPSSLYASESNPTRNRQPPRSRRIISVARLENSKFSPLRHQQRNRKSATPHSPSAVGSRQRHSSPRFHSPMKASAAAASPPPPPPRGWLSGLVSGAGRLLAAILDPESSASDTTSSSPESSESPPRRDQATAGTTLSLSLWFETPSTALMRFVISCCRFSE